MMNRTIGTGGLVMMLVVALAAIGIGIALWSKVLTIQGVVRTGTVNAEFTRVFTDDDDAVDNPDKDSMDTGDCEIVVGPETPPAPFPDKRTAPGTSCDPAETGRDPKAHYDKDVARCDAVAVPDGQDNEPQPGSQRALLLIQNAYPSYHCTAWFDILNSGTIPVLLHSLAIAGSPALPCAVGASTPYDLNGDGSPDIEICVSEIPVCPTGQRCEPQIDPKDVFQFNLDIHVMQTAPQGASLSFDAVACLHQWNEETGSCGTPNFDRIIDADGLASKLSGDPAAREVLSGMALNAWPAGDPDNAGVDTFDKDSNGVWTFGVDDIHMEGASADCPTGIRNAAHELGEDCIVLDENGDFATGQLVTCDLEGFIAFVPGGCEARIRWHDANGDGDWDPGEDIVLDVNGNGIFD
jgi:hypothetical protein